jgi:hypothetical protein
MYAESFAKRLMRLDLYLRVASGWLGPARRSAVVAIAGPAAGELGAIRHILRVSPDRVWFVDFLDRGLKIAKKEWPTTNTYQGDLGWALRLGEIESIGFVHLDLMHQWSNNVHDIFVSMRGRIAPGGIIAFAYSRRGLPTQENYVKKMLVALDVVGLDVYRPIFFGRYTGSSTMGVTAIQHVYRRRSATLYTCNNCSETVAKQILRREVRVGLLTEKFSKTQIQEILHIDASTLEAWQNEK